MSKVLRAALKAAEEKRDWDEYDRIEALLEQKQAVAAFPPSIRQTILSWSIPCAAIGGWLFREHEEIGLTCFGLAVVCVVAAAILTVTPWKAP